PGVQHDAAAHAVADQDRFFKIKLPEQGGDVAAVVPDGAFLRPAGRAAVPAQVARHDLPLALEVAHLKPPVGVIAGKAVHEHERRRAAAAAEVAHGAAQSSAAAGRCAATRFCCSCGGGGSWWLNSGLDEPLPAGSDLRRAGKCSSSESGAFAEICTVPGRGVSEPLICPRCPDSSPAMSPILVSGAMMSTLTIGS